MLGESNEISKTKPKTKFEIEMEIENEIENEIEIESEIESEKRNPIFAGGIGHSERYFVGGRERKRNRKRN